VTGSDLVTPGGAAPDGLSPDREPPKGPGPATGRLARFREPGSAPRRALITTIDQCFASASNFAVGIVVARVSGPAGLGAYSVAYTLWLAMAAAHRSAITDPMSIENDALHEDANKRLQAGLAAELTFGMAIAILVALVSLPLVLWGARPVGVALLTLAPFVPFLLAQDYWRWVGFMQARPDRSLRNDALFNGIQASSLAVLILSGLRSPSVAIVAWGVGAVAGTIYGLKQFSVVPRLRGGIAMVGSRWPMSKWLVASGAAGWGGSQAYPLLAGPAVGDAGLGGLKAAQSLVSGPSLVLLQAGGSIGLPEASRAFEKHGWAGLQRVARWVTFAGVVSVGSVSAIVFAAGHPLLDHIYGHHHQFVKYTQTANIIAVAWLIQAFGLGTILTLKATRQSRRLFQVAVVSFVVAAVAIVAFSYAWGPNGTAWGLVVQSTVTLLALYWAQRLAAREFADVKGAAA
jgi:O-antigen/teichoic acid export membrane protein